MSDYSEAFEAAVSHAMQYEVGGFWKLTPDVEAGLCETKKQKTAVGYVNDPDDAGGETKFGVAKNGNPDLDIGALTWAQAKDVYFQKYWLKGKCDQMPSKLAALHFDGCMNHGITKASMFLQKAVGATPDGAIGTKTMALVLAADELQTCIKICDLRAQFYRDIVAAKPVQAKYLNGWLRRIDEMRTFVTSDLK